MTCRELADFIADYLDGTLPAETRSHFERHLDACANCVEYLAGYTSVVTLGRRAFDDLDAPVPPTVPEELLAAILAAQR